MPMAMAYQLITFLVILLNVFPLLSLARLVVVPAFDLQQIQYVGVGWSLPDSGANSTDTNLQCPSQTAAARTSATGTELSFSFTGTSFRVVTTAGPGAASYYVLQDNEAPFLVQPKVFEPSACAVTFQSQPLSPSEHQIRVVFASDAGVDELALMSLGYEMDNATPDKKTLNTTVIIIITVCVIVAGIGIVAVILLLCCKRSRRSPDAEKGHSTKGVPYTPPPFIQYGDMEKSSSPRDLKRIHSDDTVVAGYTANPKREYGTPIYYAPPVQTQSQTRTNGSELVTAFSV